LRQLQRIGDPESQRGGNGDAQSELNLGRKPGFERQKCHFSLRFCGGIATSAHDYLTFQPYALCSSHPPAPFEIPATPVRRAHIAFNPSPDRFQKNPHVI
jgi:hypothetical protein